MIQRHKDIFFSVADQLSCLIGVREPNPLADRWIGRSGYLPKGQECKAKTSNNVNFEFGGLVVDPILCPEAFTALSLPDAMDKWNNKFLQNGELPAYFNREQDGPEKGLLRYQGFPIHADYDLMYVCSADRNTKARFTDLGEHQRLFRSVQSKLNMQFGIPMIQHGTELSWNGGVGAAESEYIYVFAPKQNFMQTKSTVSKDIREWH